MHRTSFIVEIATVQWIMIILFILLYTIVLAKYHHLKIIAKAIFFLSAIDEVLQKELSGEQMRR